MTDKRSASQQRRAKQNRASRQSLATRRAAAAEKATQDEHNAPDEGIEVSDDDVVAPDEVVEPTRRRSLFQGGAARGGKPQGARSAPARSARPVRKPSPVYGEGSGTSGWLDAVRVTPGGRWAVTSFVLSVLSAILLGIFFKVVFVTDLVAYLGETVRNTKPATHEDSRSLIQLGLPAIVVLVSPVLITAAGLAALRRPERRRAWFFCSIALGMWLILLGGISLAPASLIVAATFWFATYQNSKAERPAA